MKTLNFLNSCFERGDGVELCLVRLEERYGVTSREYVVDGMQMFVLNYSQINSPKFEGVVRECRSLVVAFDYVEGLWYSVSQAFDRFFNYGEKKLPCTVDKLEFFDKLDGSLITVFCHGGKWMYRTKSMIMPVEPINGLEVTWKDLIEEALNWEEFLKNPPVGTFSYIFEVVSPYNRVVTRYNKPEAFLLAVRGALNTGNGIYNLDYIVDMTAEKYGWSRPKKMVFDSWEKCLTYSKELRNLEEGLVGYLKGVPMVKVKNPAYVAAHHLRGEGVLTPKRIVDLILINETDEYLSIFPEDEVHFRPWIDAYNHLVETTPWDFKMRLAESQNQKDFALAVHKMPNASLLFRMKQGQSFESAWEGLTRNVKQSMIQAYKEKLKGADEW